MLGVYAFTQMGAAIRNAQLRDTNMRQLGSAGPQRVEAVATWLQARAGDASRQTADFLRRFPSVPIVKTMENLMRAFSSQGGAQFSQQHRESADTEAGKNPARAAIELLVTGRCRTITAAGKKVQLTRERLSRALGEVHNAEALRQRALREVAMSAERASARLNQLIDSTSQRVALEATKFSLGVAGIKPPSDSLSVNTGISAGWVIAGRARRARGQARRRCGEGDRRCKSRRQKVKLKLRPAVSPRKGVPSLYSTWGPAIMPTNNSLPVQLFDLTLISIDDALRAKYHRKARKPVLPRSRSHRRSLIAQPMNKLNRTTCQSSPPGIASTSSSARPPARVFPCRVTAGRWSWLATAGPGLKRR
jgi:hypothetical protein